MLKLPLAVTAVTSVLVTTGAVAQKAPPEIPLAVICWHEQTKTWWVDNLRQDLRSVACYGPRLRVPTPTVSGRLIASFD
jgi:hypothetical protein